MPVAMSVESIRQNLLAPHRVVVLKEDSGRGRILPIVIGVWESEAIAMHLRKTEVPRPMTHDLLANTIAALGGRVLRILVNDLAGETFFARIVPGWFFNIALLVHGEEALLAVGFIFTMHFFNGHLRPEKFPMDRVIFTGRITMEELQEERPDEYARLVATGGLDAIKVSEPEPWVVRLGTVIGTVAVTIGLLLVGFILYAVLK